MNRSVRLERIPLSTSETVVTLAEAKLHLGAVEVDQDEHITDILQQAQSRVENILRTPLVPIIVQEFYWAWGDELTLTERTTDATQTQPRKTLEVEYYGADHAEHALTIGSDVYFDNTGGLDRIAYPPDFQPPELSSIYSAPIRVGYTITPRRTTDTIKAAILYYCLMLYPQIPGEAQDLLPADRYVRVLLSALIR